MERRRFLAAGAAGLAGLGLAGGLLRATEPLQTWSSVGPAASIIPVVGDGKWIWNEPPANQTGYLEPRRYSVQIGIEFEGIGNANQILATTPVPVGHPEQKIDSVQVLTEKCQAQVVPLAEGAAQLLVAMPALGKGEKASAVVDYTLTISKQYFKYSRDQFPAKQNPPNEIRMLYLQDSPGIQTSSPLVKKLAGELTQQVEHPWDQAAAFARWIPPNIRPQIGSYTGVATALEKRLGDCEEMSATFVALCRSKEIPARLVWVPNHNWAEFYLVDHDGVGHWIPAHVACYHWFGWTGAHELVLQKGDRIRDPQQHKYCRLLEDWMQWGGRKPKTRYIGKLTPLPPEVSMEETFGKETPEPKPAEPKKPALTLNQRPAGTNPNLAAEVKPLDTTKPDAGPGAREKQTTGEWKLTSGHPLDKYVRGQ